MKLGGAVNLTTRNLHLYDAWTSVTQSWCRYRAPAEYVTGHIRLGDSIASWHFGSSAGSFGPFANRTEFLSFGMFRTKIAVPPTMTVMNSVWKLIFYIHIQMPKLTSEVYVSFFQLMMQPWFTIFPLASLSQYRPLFVKMCFVYSHRCHKLFLFLRRREYAGQVSTVWNRNW